MTSVAGVVPRHAPHGAAAVGLDVLATGDSDVLPPDALAPPPQAGPSGGPIVPPTISAPPGAAAVEQRTEGPRPPAEIAASFDGLGADFHGPQGTAAARNPSDNSLAVGPDHIVQIVNTRMAVFTKKGHLFDTTGRALYGPVETRNVFKGFGGPCEARNNGDAVARYDQLADRWLIVMPIFSRIADQLDPRGLPNAGEPARLSLRGVSGQPAVAAKLFQPPPPPPPPPRPRVTVRRVVPAIPVRDAVHNSLRRALTPCAMR